MNSSKNKFFLLLLFFFLPFKAQAQEKIYLIPPVQLLPLKKMETNAYGLIIAAKNDPLNEALWKNAAYPITADKFSKIPDTLPPSAENLRLKLLLTTAEPPLGTTGQAFITLKLRQLFELGYFEEVYKLIQKIPENIRTDEQKRLYADVLLLQDLQTACFLTDQASEHVFWQKLSAVCTAFNAQEDKTFLALDLLKEQNNADSFLSDAVDYFLEKKPLTTTPDKMTPLNVALWKKAGKNLGEIKDRAQNIWFKKIIVQDETVPAAEKLTNAEFLVQYGLLAPTKLRTYYQQVTFDRTNEEQALPAELYRALMIQKAAALSSMSEDNVQKQTFLKQGLLSAKKDGAKLRIYFEYPNFASTSLLISILGEA